MSCFDVVSPHGEDGIGPVIKAPAGLRVVDGVAIDPFSPPSGSSCVVVHPSASARAEDQMGPRGRPGRAVIAVLYDAGRLPKEAHL